MAFVFCRECVDRVSDFHARMFAPGRGIAEDPATGSAVAAFMGLYVEYLKPTDGVHRLRIEQGFEMKRPSLLDLGLTIAGGKLAKGEIGGDAVVVTEGVIEA
ncbi:MAG: PhzF family phenazine biosynthesis protein [Pseudolabrys sp.]|nr:PhzF family phenazine biosynthesis protein [Pseudolabrys sp.]